jgi:ABC-2 type transport system permease protein
VLLLFNVVLFGFFSEATSNAVTSVVGQEGIVRKTQFPRLVIPLSVVLTSLFNLGVNFLVVIVFILASGIEPQWSWFLFPIAVVAVFVLATTMAMGMSSLYVRFRDTAIIWGVIATALFYATPVLYPIEFVPDEYRKFILVNPLTPIFEQARHWVIDPSAPGAVEASGGGLRLLIPVAIYVVICVLGVWIFRREAPRIAEEL